MNFSGNLSLRLAVKVSRRARGPLLLGLGPWPSPLSAVYPMTHAGAGARLRILTKL